MDIDQNSLSSKIKGVWELPDILHQIPNFFLFFFEVAVVDVCSDMQIKLAWEGAEMAIT